MSGVVLLALPMIPCSSMTSCMRCGGLGVVTPLAVTCRSSTQKDHPCSDAGSQRSNSSVSVSRTQQVGTYSHVGSGMPGYGATHGPYASSLYRAACTEMGAVLPAPNRAATATPVVLPWVRMGDD